LPKVLPLNYKTNHSASFYETVQKLSRQFEVVPARHLARTSLVVAIAVVAVTTTTVVIGSAAVVRSGLVASAAHAVIAAAAGRSRIGGTGYDGNHDDDGEDADDDASH